MLGSSEFRELLIADVALVRELASARDVAAALQRYWEQRNLREVSLADELAHAARIDRSALVPIEEEVDRLISRAGGDEKLALSRHGGLDRSIHMALGEQARHVSLALTSIGVASRSPLHTVRPERYTSFEVAGEGGMGVVYQALDTEMSRTVAFKVLRPDAGTGSPGAPPESPIHAHPPGRDTPSSQIFEELKTRFLQEAWITGGMSHPGVLPVYEMGQTPERIPYYTMKFVRGQRTWKMALDDVRQGSVEERLKLLEHFLKLCDTVAYAHSRGLIHRDLKPENVALGEFGEVVLLDWGLAKLEGSEDHATSRWQERVRELRSATDLRTIGGAGTAGYMSPEAAKGRLELVDARSDVYSLGALLYETLTGRLPYDFRSYAEYIDAVCGSAPPHARSVAPAVPEALSDLCALCLSGDRSARPESVTALSTAIRAWQSANSLEREAEAHHRDALAALRAAEQASGDDRLRHIDRAAASLTQLETVRPEHPQLAALVEGAKTLRATGLRERERASSRKLLKRVAIAALVVTAVAGYLVAVALEERRAMAEAQAARAITAMNQADAERKRADVRSEEAESRLHATFQHLGRAELRSGRRLHAAAYLSAAYSGGRQDLSIRFRLAEACRPLDALLVTLHAPDHGRYGVVFSPDATKILTPGPRNTAKLWDAATGVGITTLKGHSKAIITARFSPDGVTVLTASLDGTARLWSTASGRQLVKLKGHYGALHTAIYGPEGGQITTASVDRTVRVWDANSGRELSLCKLATDTLTYADLSPDGLLLVSALGGRLTLWDVKTGVELDSLQYSFLHRGEFVDGGEKILFTEEHGTRLWDTEDSSEIYFEGISGPAVLSQDGMRLVTADGQEARIWNAVTGRLMARLVGHRAGVSSVAISPDQSMVATTSRDDTVRLWEVATGTELYPLIGHQGPARRATFSPDGAMVATEGSDGTVRLWRTSRGRRRKVLTGHVQAVTKVAFSAAGADLLTVDTSSAVVIWDPRRMRERLELQASTREWCSAELGAKGTRLLTCGAGEVRLWDLRSGEHLRTIRITDAEIRSARFCAGGDQICTTDSGSATRLWVTSTGEEVAVLVREPVSVQVSSDGGRIATRGASRVTIWSVLERKAIGTVKPTGGRRRIVRSRLSSDGNRLAVHEATQSMSSHTAVVYEVNPQRRLSAVPLGGRARFMVFGPKGERLATSTDDHRARVWDVSTGETLHVLEGHVQPIASASFSPDGRVLATASLDGTVKLWDLDTGLLLLTCEGHEGGAGQAVFSPDGRTLVTRCLLPRERRSGDSEFHASGGRMGEVYVWDVSYETRSPKEIAELVEELCPFRIEGGSLVSADEQTTD